MTLWVISLPVGIVESYHSPEEITLARWKDILCHSEAALCMRR
jgi:hypothetical protein